MLYFIAMLFVSLALSHVAALGAILWRHAIPRAPRVFHLLLLFPMLACIASLAALAYIALSGADPVLGLPALAWLALFFVFENIVWWTLVAYSVFYYVANR